MPANSIALFNFYRRYIWQPEDFELLQESLSDQANALGDGLVGPAAVAGFDVQSDAATLGLTITPGMAIGPSGCILAITGNSTVTMAAPAGNPCRSLVVARLLDTPSDYIPRPTNPEELVPLHEVLTAQIVAINGTAAANPQYPAIGANDVILCGVVLEASASAITSWKLDFQARDYIGKNTLIHKNVPTNDDRLLPYTASGTTTSIKPSQTIPPAPKLVLNIGGLTACKFPLTGGAFTAQDTILNWTSGAITGGDGTSADFTPTIPGAGSYVWALISLQAISNTLLVKYGTAGNLQQCMAASISRSISGAGCLAEGPGYKIAQVLLYSSGSAILSNTVFDARQDNPPTFDSVFTLVNNQGATDLTGFLFDAVQFRRVVFDYDIERRTDTAASECIEVGTCYAMYSTEDATWNLEFDSHTRKNIAGVTFTMSGSQMQYATTNIAGANGIHKFNYRNVRVFHA